MAILSKFDIYFIFRHDFIIDGFFYFTFPMLAPIGISLKNFSSFVSIVCLTS